MNLEQSKTTIIQTTLNTEPLFWSSLEKENDSGFFFNQRIFFLQPQMQLGYISDASIQPTSDAFRKTKNKIQFIQLKQFFVTDGLLTLKFWVKEEEKKTQKKWVFKAANLQLIKKWQSKLKQQKTKDILRNTNSKLIEQQQLYQSQVKERSVSRAKSKSRHKRLTLNTQTITLSEQLKQQKSLKDIGIDARENSIKSLEPLKPLTLIETKQIGTVMSKKSILNNDSNPSQKSLKRQISFRDANIGTSTIQAVQNNYMSNRTEQKSLVSESLVESMLKSDLRSQARQQMKSGNIKLNFNKSESPANQPEIQSYNYKYGPTKTEYVPQFFQPKDVHTSYAEKSTSKLDFTVELPFHLKEEEEEVQVVNHSSAKDKDRQLSPEQYEKMELWNQYYTRTSELIKRTSVAPMASVQEEKDLQIQADYQSNNFNSRERLPKIVIEEEIPKENSTPVQQLFPMANTPHSNQSYDFIKQSSSNSAVDMLRQIPWVFKYLKFGQLMFSEFTQYTQDLMKDLIRDMRLPTHQQQYQVKTVRNGIRYYEIGGIQVKLASVTLGQSSAVNRQQQVCNKELVKVLQNQYNNFVTLYEYLGQNSNLRVPLVCLNQLYGTVALFKTKPKVLQQPVKARQVQAQLLELQKSSKISQDFQPIHKHLFKLNHQYYDKFKQVQSNYDANLDFDLIFIQEIDNYLPPDMSPSPQTPLAILRRQLIQIHATSPLQYQTRRSGAVREGKPSKDIAHFSKYITRTIQEVAQQIDSLQIFFYNSQELSQHIHNRGLGIRHLGNIYRLLTTLLPQQIIMSELAARSTKSILRRTLKDLQLQQHHSPLELQDKIIDFLNNLLGSGNDTSAMWKLLSVHSRQYFQVDINIQNIHPGYLLMALAHNCGLEVVWQKVNPQEMFKSNFFFSRSNFRGVKVRHKIYPPFYNNQFQQTLNIIQAPQSEKGFKMLTNELQLQNIPLSPVLQTVSPHIKKYLASFTDPTLPELPHLQIYQDIHLQPPSQLLLDIRLIQIRWFLKLDSKEELANRCSEFVNLTTRIYGEFHPAFSELYDLLAAYHGDQGNHPQAIAFAKSSLVNTISLCGTAHSRTAAAYYQLAVQHLNANKTQQALANLNKSKKILNLDHSSNSPIYASVLLKTAIVSLCSDKISECLSQAQKALLLFERLQIATCEDELTECLQAIGKCYQIEGNYQKIRQLSQYVSPKLQFINSPDNIRKMLKLMLLPILSDLPRKSASIYLDLISQLPRSSSTRQQSAFQLIKQRMRQGDFENQVYEYLNRLSSMGPSTWLGQLARLGQSQQSQTVNNFINMTQQLVYICGQDFLRNILRRIVSH